MYIKFKYLDCGKIFDEWETIEWLNNDENVTCYSHCESDNVEHK